MTPQPAGTWGFHSSWEKGMPGRDGWDGRGHPRWGDSAPLQTQEKLLGLRVGTAGLEEPPKVRGQLVAGNDLAELKFLVEDAEFWADLGRNIGQRACAGRGGQLSCVPSGLCPVSQQGQGRC